MLVVDRFGLPPLVDHKQLAAMQPHVRSECLALMREAGLSDEFIGRRLNVRPEIVRAVAEAKHRYTLPKLVAGCEAEDEGDDDVSTVVKIEGLPRGAFMVLKFALERQNEFALSKDGLSKELNQPLKAVDAGMSRLLSDGYIVRVRAGSGGKPPLYRLTETGEKIAAMIFTGVIGA